MSIIINQEKGTGELRLDSSHSIVLGHKPKKINVNDLANQLISDNNQTQVESFGLWEVASPNYSTYYPEVTAEDLNPKDVDFIQPVFRLLSEVIVSKGYRPIDFSKPGVLKKSMQMLVGQTINIDHEIAVGNAVGSVSEVYWQESYKTKSGITVPAGINGVLKIDGKSNPRIARGIMMEPPSIHSNSVTIRFKWEPSHKLDDQNSFWGLLGSYDNNGEMYRLVVTDVMGYSETSLVSHGADVYAQKVKADGEIVNPEYAEKQYSFSKDEDGRELIAFQYDYKQELKLSADKDDAIPTENNNNNTGKQTNSFNMNDLIQQFISELGFTAEDALSKDNLVTKVKEKLNALETSNQTLKQEKEDAIQKASDLEAEKLDLETEVENFKANQVEVDKITSLTREEATKLYKLVKDKDADENIISLIQTADLKAAGAFVKQYQKEADEKFQETCSDCGGHNISRSSATATKEGLVHDEQEGKKTGVVKSAKDISEVRNSLRDKTRSKSRILKDN